MGWLAKSNLFPLQEIGEFYMVLCQEFDYKLALPIVDLDSNSRECRSVSHKCKPEDLAITT